jgi:tetratricopeptide (TPR) repeat protein
MSTKLIHQDLAFKCRSAVDLARFVRTRAQGTPNYSLLLGAGCSITSGIRSANELVRVWRREVARELIPGSEKLDGAELVEALTKTQNGWYDPNREYSSLFERRYDLQPQRRMFVEQEVAGKSPSIGYAYLVSLVNQGYFNTIFTTNFDDLLNEAFFLFSDERPIICAQDSSINGVTVTSRRPKVIKLHSDYLFDDIKATSRETESLEQNMKAKFAEFAKDSGLIVLGYAGNDRSVMDVLSNLLRSDNHFKNGIYWCVRRDSEISDELRKLLWRERVYFVEMDGFDEAFAELYKVLNDGDVIPISTTKVSSRTNEIIRMLIEGKQLESSKSEAIREANTTLQRELTTDALYSLLRKSKDDDRAVDHEMLRDEELVVVLQAADFLKEDKFAACIELCRGQLSTFERRPAKIALLRSIAASHRYLGDVSAAASVFDEMIRLEPHVASHHLNKLSLLSTLDERKRAVDAATAADPFTYRTHAARANLLDDLIDQTHGQAKTDLIEQASEELERGIERWPALGNPCWDSLFDVFGKLDDVKDARLKQSKVVERLERQRPLSVKVLSKRSKWINRRSEHAEVQLLIGNLTTAKDKANSEILPRLEAIHLDVLGRVGNLSALRTCLDVAVPRYDYDNDFLIRASEFERQKFGDDSKAVELLQKVLARSPDTEAAVELIQCYLDCGLLPSAEATLDKFGKRMGRRSQGNMRIAILEERGDYDQAIAEVDKLSRVIGSDGYDRNYLLIKKGAYEFAEAGLRKLLEAISFALTADTHIINFELAKKLQAKKVNKDRVQNLLEFTRTDEVKASCYALLDNHPKALEHVSLAIEDDRTRRHTISTWPVMAALRADPAFAKLVAMGPVVSDGTNELNPRAA